MRQRAPLPMAAAVAAVLLAGGVGLAGSIGSAAVVAWPPSAGLVVGEVVTGGASASDEFAEIYNASAAGIDLGGLELVYVTSSGSTVTRKATWAGGTVLPARSHLLVANTAGVFASLADAVYSGGFAATGGSLVLRPIGGTPIDSVAWGDATNAFVEGSAAMAPPAGQSIERRPGGLGGNGTDTNSNAADLFMNSGPAAQNLSAPPVPAPSVTPSPTPTVTPPAPTPSETPMPPATESPAPTETPTDSPTPTPTASSEPTTSPVPTATESPVVTPTQSPVVTPTESPVVTPSPAPTASSSPSSAATPSPSPLLTVAEARMRTNGELVDVIATLTTQTGLTESGTGAFIQDATGGVALYLASADWPSAAAGTVVIVHGTVDDRYSQRTIRLASAGDIAIDGPGFPADAIDVGTGLAGEAFESRLVSVIGRVTSAADALTDGFAVTVDDGSGPLRVVAAGPSGIAPSALPAQAWFRLTGPLGQRDSGGTGTAGYRLYLRSADDVVPLPTPSPTPSASPSPTASATPGPTPTPSQSDPTPTPRPTSAPGTIPSAVPSASPSPSPAPTPATTPIAIARGFPLGTVVTVQGTVTAEAGRIIDSRTAFLQDATAGLALHLPTAGWPVFRRGDVLRVTGPLAAPYGNLEIRPPTAGAIWVVGSGALPAPRAVTSSAVGESIEGLLVGIVGVVDAIDAPTASGNFGVDFHDASGTFRVYVYATTSLARDLFVRGATLEVTGIEGQRAPSAGSTAGHRVWPRDANDVRRVATPVPSTGPTPTPGPGPTPTADPGSPASIASAILAGGVATIAGTVTTPAGFVDADGRRVVVEDATGALLARFPSDIAAPAVGTRLIANGALGTYYGSPQLELSAAPSVTGLAPLPPRLLSAPPGIDQAWRLVRVSGAVTEVHRFGTTWRAELSVGGASVPIYGTARSGVPSTALVEGHTASVAGVVRPPYPSATDRRSAVAPRFVADIVLGGVPGSTGGYSSAGSTGSVSGTASSAAGRTPGDQAAALDVELAELSEHLGERVRVGGLATLLGTDRIEIDDGTATAAIVLPAEAIDLGAEIVVGEPLNAVGRVVPDGERWAVAPESASDIARVGSLGELAPLATPSPASASDPAEHTGPQTLASHEPWPIGPLPTLVAVVGTLGMVAIRRRQAALLARRALGALPSGGPIGAARDALRAVRARLRRSHRA